MSKLTHILHIFLVCSVLTNFTLQCSGLGAGLEAASAKKGRGASRDTGWRHHPDNPRPHAASGARAARHERSQDHDVTSDGDESIFVLRGRRAALECFSDKNLDVTDPAFDWATSEGGPLKDGRFRTLKDGSLVISDSQAKDTMEYLCTVQGSDKSGKAVKQTFAHILTVFVLPDINYAVRLKYVTSSCDGTLKEKKVAGIRSSLCTSDSCDVSDVTGKCHAVTHGSLKHELWVDLKVLPSDDLTIPECTVACMVKTVMATLDAKLATVKGFAGEEAEDNGEFRLKDDGLEVELQSFCPGGYRKDNAVCVPCSPGTYSKDRDTVCSPCSTDTYQPEVAMVGCEKCEEGTHTTETGSKTEDACKRDHVVKVDMEVPKTTVVVLTILVLLVVCGICGVVLKVLRNAGKKAGLELQSKKGGAAAAAAEGIDPQEKPAREADMKGGGRWKTCAKQAEQNRKFHAKERKERGAMGFEETQHLLPANFDRRQVADDIDASFFSDDMYMQPVPSRGYRNYGGGETPAGNAGFADDHHVYDTVAPDTVCSSVSAPGRSSGANYQPSNPSSNHYHTIDSLHDMKASPHRPPRRSGGCSKTRQRSTVIDKAQAPPPLPPPRKSSIPSVEAPLPPSHSTSAPVKPV